MLSQLLLKNVWQEFLEYKIDRMRFLRFQQILNVSSNQ